MLVVIALSAAVPAQRCSAQSIQVVDEQAQITRYGKRVHLGYFETAEEALDFKKRQVMAAEGPVQLTRSGKAVEAKPVSKERGDA